MSHTRFLLLFVCSFAISLGLLAQQKTVAKNNANPADKHTPTGKKVLLPYVYLGSTEYRGGRIQKSVFDELIKQGLTAHDSLGNKYKVLGFDFSYGERNLYEDSLGNSEVLTDYLTEYCTGNTLTSGVAASLSERSKPGDSVYFDGVRVLKLINATETAPATDVTLGVGMKFVITK